MTHEDQVLELFARANPEPYPGLATATAPGPVHLEAIDDRSKPMQKTNPTTLEPPEGPPTRRAWIFAAVAVLIVLAGISALFLASIGDDESASGPDEVTTSVPEASSTSSTSTSTSTSTSSTTLAAFDDVMATVQAMIEVRNSGDYEAWRAFFPATRPVIWSGTVEDESELEWQRSYMAANEVWIITGDCQYLLDNGVKCPMRLVNDFLGPAGIFYDVPSGVSFHVDDDGLISRFGASDWVITANPDDYMNAFYEWLGEAHPDVHASLDTSVEDGDVWFPYADDMPTVLQYVDEFLAQSDVYPVAP